MICFAWVEFPQYGARLIGAFARSAQERVVVVATKPRIPIKGMERLTCCEIFWEEKSSRRSLLEITGEVPSALFVSGWSLPIYRQYCREVGRNGGIVAAMVDNDYKFSVVEILKNLRFRLLLRRRFDAFVVPGLAGRKILKSYGVKESDIYTGLYAADGSLFVRGSTLSRRPKKIIYVGQFCDRKNTLRMCRAFLIANSRNGGEWQLELCGKGPLKDSLPDDNNIVIHDFIQPEELPILYCTSRGFMLPSVSDHWGVVVHEAALSGCALLLSNKVGASRDFLGKRNGVSFNPRDESAIAFAFEWLMKLGTEELDAAYDESIELSHLTSISKFVESVQTIVSRRGRRGI